MFELWAVIMKSVSTFTNGTLTNHAELQLEPAWKLLMLPPIILLFRPVRGGLSPHKKLPKRLTQSTSGDSTLLLEHSSACVEVRAQTCSGQTRSDRGNDRRAARAGKLVQLEEVSAGRQVLKGDCCFSYDGNFARSHRSSKATSSPETLSEVAVHYPVRFHSLAEYIHVFTVCQNRSVRQSTFSPCSTTMSARRVQGKLLPRWPLDESQQYFWPQRGSVVSLRLRQTEASKGSSLVCAKKKRPIPPPHPSHTYSGQEMTAWPTCVLHTNTGLETTSSVVSVGGTGARDLVSCGAMSRGLRKMECARLGLANRALFLRTFFHVSVEGRVRRDPPQ